jgi:hypothetical protein
MKVQYTHKLLSLLSKNHYGLNSAQIVKAFEDEPDMDERNIRVMLCHLVNRGRLIRDGRDCCKECGAAYTLYRISDLGRIQMAN